MAEDFTMSRQPTDPFEELGRDPSESPDTDASLASAAALEASESEISKLRADLDDASERVLRAQAELDNYRKRVRREMEDERRHATLPLLRDLLPVLDPAQPAIAAAEKSPSGNGRGDAVRLVAQSLET